MTGPLVSESLARLSTGLSRRDARDVGQLLQELASRVRESPAAIAAYAKVCRLSGDDPRVLLPLHGLTLSVK